MQALGPREGDQSPRGAVRSHEGRIIELELKEDYGVAREMGPSSTSAGTGWEIEAGEGLRGRTGDESIECGHHDRKREIGARGDVGCGHRDQGREIGVGRARSEPGGCGVTQGTRVSGASVDRVKPGGRSKPGGNVE